MIELIQKHSLEAYLLTFLSKLVIQSYIVVNFQSYFLGEVYIVSL